MGFAHLYVDAEPRGKTPLSVALPGGEHTLRLERDGYLESRRTVTILAGWNATVRVTLIPAAPQSGRKFPGAVRGTQSAGAGQLSHASDARRPIGSLRDPLAPWRWRDGEVYKARDTRLDRTVAIKVLPEHVAVDPDLRQRFEREVKALVDEAGSQHGSPCTPN